VVALLITKRLYMPATTDFFCKEEVQPSGWMLLRDGAFTCQTHSDHASMISIVFYPLQNRKAQTF
jgi:hypothetical protein